MDILEAFEHMISAIGLPLNKVCIDASLFRSVGARTNIGLINAENLSIQIHVATMKSAGSIEDKPKSESRLPLPAGSQPVPINGDQPADSRPSGPRVVENHLFDVRNIFRFNPDYVFDEKKLTINTVPIYFVRRGGQVLCDITIRNVTLCTETFSARHGEPSISEEVFRKCEQPTSNALGLRNYDSRLARLISHERGHFYRNGGDLLICVFPTSPRKTLPLGKDDGVFPVDRFGPAVLVCVARPSRGTGASYRIQSHFYVVSDNAS